MEMDQQILATAQARQRHHAPFVAALLALAPMACSQNEDSHSGPSRSGADRTQRVVDGNPEKGRSVIAAVECGVCHVIPGVRGAHGIVGPPLTAFARRQFIAGVVPNQPAVLVKWVKDAPSIAPNTGMPDLPLTEDEARHVAAYLYTLR